MVSNSAVRYTSENRGQNYGSQAKIGFYYTFLKSCLKKKEEEEEYATETICAL